MKTSVSILATFLSIAAFAQRHMEFLNRGVYAINEGNGKVFVSWRLLGTEPQNQQFNLYRSVDGKQVKLNSTPLVNGTNFEDSGMDTTKAITYSVKPIINAKETAAETFTLQPNSKPYLSIPLKTPAGYTPNDASVGDVDGDGQYEIIIHMAGRGRDNPSNGFTDPPIFHAYKLDGSFLWEINLEKTFGKVHTTRNLL